MSEPVKTNDDIRADKEAFMKAYERARAQFMRIKGVEGVGFGHKEIGGKFTDNIAITIFVREKKPEGDIPPEHRIPPTFEGYRTDVRIVPELKLAVCEN